MLQSPQALPGTRHLVPALASAARRFGRAFSQHSFIRFSWCGFDRRMCGLFLMIYKVSVPCFCNLVPGEDRYCRAALVTKWRLCRETRHLFPALGSAVRRFGRAFSKHILGTRDTRMHSEDWKGLQPFQATQVHTGFQVVFSELHMNST